MSVAVCTQDTTSSITANTIKNVLMAHYRFQRQFAYVATECWDCDVVVSDGHSLIEIEVKLTWADYKKEFTKDKHRVCPNQYFLTSKGIQPNKRYFAAPIALAERIATDAATRCPVYGVMAVEKYHHTILRRAAMVHKDPVSAGTLHSMVKRISSELITVRQQVRK